MTTIAPNRQNLVAYGIIAAVLVANVIFTYETFTKPYPGHNDFLTVWEGARSYFYDGLDPYGEAVSTRIQERIYGRHALPDEFPNHYAYPFYATFFVWPTIHFDYAWATALWMVFLEACLIVALLLVLDLFRWRPKPLTLAGLMVFSLMAYPAARGLFLGQVSHAVYLLQVAALWGIARDRDRLAGIALACATFKPQMVLLFVPFLLLWGFSVRRWRFLAAFGVTFAALSLISFIMLPDWLDGMIYQIDLYPGYIEVSTPAWVIAQYLFDLGSAAEWAINLFFYSLMLWTWYTVLVEKRADRFLWAVMVTITVTHLVAFRTATPHFVVFTLPLVFYLRHFARQRRHAANMILLLALFFLPWLHFFATLDAAKFEHPTLFVPLPLLSIVALWFTRRLWWNQAPTLAPVAAHDEGSVTTQHSEGQMPT